MGRAVGSDEAGAVDGKSHRQPLHCHIVHHLVIGALEEGRVDRGKRLIALGGKACSKRQQFLFVNGRAVRKNRDACRRAAWGLPRYFLPPDRHGRSPRCSSACQPRRGRRQRPPGQGGSDAFPRPGPDQEPESVGAIKQRLNEALHRATTTGKLRTATILCHAPATGLPRSVIFPPMGLARLARGARLAEPAQASFADMRALRGRLAAARANARGASPLRSARRGRNCMGNSRSSPRTRRAASSSSTSMRGARCAPSDEKLKRQRDIVGAGSSGGQLLHAHGGRSRPATRRR